MKPLCVDAGTRLILWSRMSLWFLRRHRCHLCGTQHSVTLMAWVCGWLHIFAQCKQRTVDIHVCIYLHVWMCCIMNTKWQRPAIVPPMVYLHLTQAGAWCEMWFISAMLRLCSEDKDIYWAAHNTALFTDHQLYPLPCAFVINVA